MRFTIFSIACRFLRADFTVGGCKLGLSSSTASTCTRKRLTRPRAPHPNMAPISTARAVHLPASETDIALSPMPEMSSSALASYSLSVTQSASPACIHVARVNKMVAPLLDTSSTQDSLQKGASQHLELHLPKSLSQAVATSTCSQSHVHAKEETTHQTP